MDSPTTTHTPRRTTLSLVVAVLLLTTLPFATRAIAQEFDDTTASDSGPASVVVPLDPIRILDTRAGVGVTAGLVASNQVVTLQVTGTAGIPGDAVGVLLNITVTAAGGAGCLCATGVPSAAAAR